jgi:hypothetical protein
VWVPDLKDRVVPAGDGRDASAKSPHGTGT